MTDRATDIVAVGAVTSPFWMPTLGQLSQIAAAATPILGVLWLLIQIYARLAELWEKRKQQKLKERYENGRAEMDCRRASIHRTEGDHRIVAQSEDRRDGKDAFQRDDL